MRQVRSEIRVFGLTPIQPQQIATGLSPDLIQHLTVLLDPWLLAPWLLDP